MKRLLIDMDDVICENGFIRMINEFLGTNYKSCLLYTSPSPRDTR